MYPALSSAEGELVLARIAVDPRLLEELLEALAELDFPVNPQIYHSSPQAVVEFPAYTSRLAEAQDILEKNGFERAMLRVVPVLDSTAA